MVLLVSITNTQCIIIINVVFIDRTPDERSCNQRSYDVPAVISLRNDEKTKFHTDHETDSPELS